MQSGECRSRRHLPAPRSSSLRVARPASTADPAHRTKRVRVQRLGDRIRAIGELVWDDVVRADESPRLSAESLLEYVRAVHGIILSCDVRGNAAEIESARAPLACFDDAPPEERVRRVGGAPRVVGRGALIDIALAAAPRQRSGDRLTVLFGEADPRMTRGNKRSPHAAVVIPRARDEAGALSRFRVEVVQRVEVVVAVRVANAHATLLRLADAPARVLLERPEERVLLGTEVELERGDDGLDVRRTPEAGGAKRASTNVGIDLRAHLQKDRPPFPSERCELRERHLKLGRVARDGAAGHVRQALAGRKRTPQDERARQRGGRGPRRGRGPAELVELRAPTLALADLRPRRRLQHVTAW